MNRRGFLGFATGGVVMAPMAVVWPKENGAEVVMPSAPPVAIELQGVMSADQAKRLRRQMTIIAETEINRDRTRHA